MEKRPIMNDYGNSRRRLYRSGGWDPMNVGAVKAICKAYREENPRIYNESTRQLCNAFYGRWLK